MAYTVEVAATALEALKEVRDTRVRNALDKRITALAEEPEKQGKPLTDDLKGYYSVRAVGQRYRIIYRVVRDGDKVTVVLVGIRREDDRDDVYTLAGRLVRRGLM